MTLITKYAKYGSAVIASFAVAVALLVGSTPRVADAAVTSAGGVATLLVSANANGLNTFTPLTNIVFTEANAGELGLGTIILTAPSGYTFQTTPAVSVTPAGTALAAALTSNTGTVITVTVTVVSAATGSLTLGNLAVKASTAAVAAVGGTIAKTGTSNAVYTAGTGVLPAGTLDVGNYATRGSSLGATSTVAGGVGATTTFVTAQGTGVVQATFSTSGGGTFASNNGTTLFCNDGNTSCDISGAAGVIAVAMNLPSSGAPVVTVTPIGAGAASTITYNTLVAAAGPVASISLVTTSGAAAYPNNGAAAMTITVLDASGTTVANGTVISLTTSSGTFSVCNGGTTTALCSLTLTSGTAAVEITGASVSGPVTVSATSGAVTTTLSFTFTGTTAGSVSLAVRQPNPATGAASALSGASTPAPCGAFVAVSCLEDILSATVKDAAGNNAAGITVTFSVAPADGKIAFENLTSGLPNGTTGTTASSSASATTIGQARIGIQVATSAVPGTVYTITASAAASTGTVSSTTTVTVGDTVSSTTTVLTVTAPDVAAASTSTITVAVTGLNGKPIGDGTFVTLVTSAGVVANIANGTSVGPNPAPTSNGKATFTFVSPSTVGAVNATALVGTKTGSALFNVTAASAPAPTPAPAGTGFSGGTIAPAGVSIVSFTGATTQLGTDGATAKVVTVSATVGGKLITFVVGAPAFVNADFNAAFPTGLTGTLVIVKTGA